MLLDSPEAIEGLIIAVAENGEMLSMKNIEVSPSNYGNSKDVAGCLIAFACELSFQLGKGAYNGFLTFESKTILVEFYKKKYGATHAGGHMMFIDDEQGKNLIKKYLEK